MIHQLRVFGFSSLVAGLVLAGCGSGDPSDAEVGETTSEISLPSLCSSICAGVGGAACFSLGGGPDPVGVAGAIACAEGGNIACENVCKRVPYRPKKRTAEECLQKSGLGYPNCYATTEFEQQCTVHWGNTGDWGHAAVKWKSAGSGPPVIITYKINNGGPLHTGEIQTYCK
jgi:hypothetical protein